MVFYKLWSECAVRTTRLKAWVWFLSSVKICHYHISTYFLLTYKFYALPVWVISAVFKIFEFTFLLCAKVAVVSINQPDRYKLRVWILWSNCLVTLSYLNLNILPVHFNGLLVWISTTNMKLLDELVSVVFIFVNGIRVSLHFMSSE